MTPRRICPDFYTTRLCDVFVQAHLPVTRCLDDVWVKMEEMFRSYLRAVSSNPAGEYVSVYLKMMTLGISVSHRAIIKVLAPMFEIEVSEAKSPLSKQARVFDIKGHYRDILGFLPVFKYCIAAYDKLSRKYIDGLTLIRYEKHLQRKVYTQEFCDKLVLIWNGVLHGAESD